MITVYSKTQCPNCLHAKNLLERKGIAFAEVNIEIDDNARAFLVEQGFRSVPQIFIDGEVVTGGYQWLAKQPQEYFDQLTA
jgi:glutaredoxin 3